MTSSKHQATPAIDCAFPGGNIVVEVIAGSQVQLRQDLRDTHRWWFYWCFRIKNAAGRTLDFRFTQGDVIGPMGPAISTDGGMTWEWRPQSTISGNELVHSFGSSDQEAILSFGMTYTERHLRRFLAIDSRCRRIRSERLCFSEKGRAVERLHFGCLARSARHKVLVTCRHHSCEMMANYVLEGIIGAVLADTEEGRWFAENVEYVAIPVVDKDGVEDGDQGKNRIPHDHGRDYAERRYAAVKALCAFVPEWSQSRLRLALDLHCPGIRGEHNEAIYLVGDRKMEQEQCRFSELLEAVRAGPLPFQASDYLPYGQAWNNDQNYAGGKNVIRWVSEFPEIRLASAMEIPYALARGAEVNAHTARAFGGDLARAMFVYLRGA